MSPVKHIGKAVWKCSCLICNLLNLLLALIAIGLGGLVLLNVFQKSIPVPDKIANWLINRSTPDHLNVAWTGIAFDLRGGFYLQGFRLRNLSTEQILVTAEETFIQWSPLDFFLPHIPAITEVDARKIDVYIPASHSPSGLNEPVITIDHIYSRQQNGIFILDSLLLQTGGMRLYLNGEASIALLLEAAGGSSDASSVAASNRNIYPLLQQLARLPEDFRMDIDANWMMLPDQTHQLQVDGFLPHFNYKDIEVMRAHASATASVRGNSVMLDDLRIYGTLLYLAEIPAVPFLNIPESPVPIPFRLSAKGEPVKVGAHALPSDIHLSLHPDDPEIRFHHLILKSAFSENLDAPIDWILMGPTAFAEGSSRFAVQPDKDNPVSFPTDFDFRAYLPNWTIYQVMDAPLPDKLLVGTKADNIRFTGSFDLEDLNLEGLLAADGLNVGQTQFAHLFASLTLNRQNILFDDIRVNMSPIEYASGSYHHHFPSSKFSLNAAGVIYPSSLDAILGNWWINIFTNIDAGQPLPGDVTVWGHWNDLSSLRSVTEVHGPGASYNGVALPEMELRVRSSHEWAYLEVLRAWFPDGEISGTIAIQSGLQDTDPLRAYRLDLTSTAPWAAVLAATGLKSLQLLDFRDANPHLKVNGIMWQDSGKGYNAENTAELRLSVQQREGYCMLRTLKLSGLTTIGTVRGKKVELRGLSGQFAGGIFTGHMEINNWQSSDDMRQHIDIDLINAGYGTALEQLTGFVNISSPSATAEPVNVPGFLDAELELTYGKGMESYSGKGNISIHEGQLGTVHMFGELSRLLGGLGLGFTSVEMDSLSLDWQLAGPALNIRNGKVTGPALNLTLAGWVDLETRGLQLKSDLTLFSGVFSKMLTPVSDTFKLTLIGTLEDPEWRIRFNPFGWAINRLNGLESGPQD